VTGVYDITAKASHWLRQKRTNQPITASGVSGLLNQLVNAAVTGDNVVSLSHLTALRAAYYGASGDPNWNSGADLDGDGAVSLPDFTILRKDFSRAGDYVLGVPIDIPDNPPFG
jgi:hypothetical protein